MTGALDKMQFLKRYREVTHQWALQYHVSLSSQSGFCKDASFTRNGVQVSNLDISVCRTVAVL